MKVGVIARAEARGLGHQTLEVVRHLHPDRVLLVEPRPEAWPLHREWYTAENVTRAAWKRGQLAERVVRPWLAGLDVVYTAESDYDCRLPAWCAIDGVTLVRHANPEQLAPEEIRDDGTVWWAATDWRLERLPAGTRVVPMPVATEHFTASTRPPDGLLRLLHSVGHAAQDDRAGSRCTARAIRNARDGIELTVRCQDRRMDVPFERGNVRWQTGGINNYWEQYDGFDALVLPRRYGGLSLPSQEAMAAGLVLIMPDCPPNQVWPGPKIRVHGSRTIYLRCGAVVVHDADPDDLTRIMNRLHADRDELAALRKEATAWATANSWEALQSTWNGELARASSSPSTATANTA